VAPAAYSTGPAASGGANAAAVAAALPVVEEDDDNELAAADPDEGSSPDDPAVMALMSRAALMRDTGAHVPPLGVIVPPEDAEDIVDRSMPGTDAATGFKPISASLAYRIVTDLGWAFREDGAVLNAHDHDRGDIRQDRDAYVAWMAVNAHRTVTDFSRASLQVLLTHEEGNEFDEAELRAIGLNPAVMRDPVTDEQLRPVVLFSLDESCMRVGDVRDAGLQHPTHERQGDAIPAKATTGGTVMLFAILSPASYEAGTAISIGKEEGGWWTNARLLAYMEETIPTLQHRWAGCELVFLFDNAPSHRMMGPVNSDPSDLNLRDGATRKGAKLQKSSTWRRVDAFGKRLGTSPSLSLMTGQNKAIGLRRLVRKIMHIAAEGAAGPAAGDDANASKSASEGEGEGDGEDGGGGEDDGGGENYDLAEDEDVEDADEDDEGDGEEEEEADEDEQGISKWSKETCIEYLLQVRPDFRFAASLLQQLCTRLGATALYTPKLHCELQWVERFWAWIKRWARRHVRGIASDTPLDQLAKALAEAMRGIGADAPAYIYHSFINASRYLQLYPFGLAAPAVFVAVRLVVGHGRILAVTRAHRFNGILLDDATGGADGIGDGDGEMVEAPEEGPAAEADDAARWEGQDEPQARLSSEDAIALLEVNKTTPEQLFSGRIGRGKKHNPTCQGCGRGAALRRALHACEYCYNVYHTGCIVPLRTEMPLPLADFACPVCCLLMENHIKDTFQDGERVVAEMALEAVAAPLVCPALDPRAVFDLLTTWTHWTAERREARWTRVAVRFGALVGGWPAPVAVSIARALSGAARAHPIFSIRPTGERVSYAV
jgi:hypothetical protein